MPLPVEPFGHAPVPHHARSSAHARKLITLAGVHATQCWLRSQWQPRAHEWAPRRHGLAAEECSGVSRPTAPGCPRPAWLEPAATRSPRRHAMQAPFVPYHRRSLRAHAQPFQQVMLACLLHFAPRHPTPRRGSVLAPGRSLRAPLAGGSLSPSHRVRRQPWAGLLGPALSSNPPSHSPNPFCGHSTPRTPLPRASQGCEPHPSCPLVPVFRPTRCLRLQRCPLSRGTVWCVRERAVLQFAARRRCRRHSQLPAAHRILVDSCPPGCRSLPIPRRTCRLRPSPGRCGCCWTSCPPPEARYCKIGTAVCRAQAQGAPRLLRARAAPGRLGRCPPLESLAMHLRHL